MIFLATSTFDVLAISFVAFRFFNIAQRKSNLDLNLFEKWAVVVWCLQVSDYKRNMCKDSSMLHAVALALKDVLFRFFFEPVHFFFYWSFKICRRKTWGRTRPIRGPCIIVKFYFQTTKFLLVSPNFFGFRQDRQDRRTDRRNKYYVLGLPCFLKLFLKN